MISSSADLIERMKLANSAVTKNNDNSVFISIHHNASPSSPYIKGLETYYYDGVNFYQPDYPPDPMQISINKYVESYLLEYGSDNVVEELEVIGGVVNKQSSQSVINRLK